MWRMDAQLGAVSIAGGGIEGEVHVLFVLVDGVVAAMEAAGDGDRARGEGCGGVDGCGGSGRLVSA